MKTNVQRVRDHRERKKAMKLFSDVSSAIQKQIYDDLKFSLSHNEKGNLVITWDMDESTNDFLKGYAAAKGLTYDELMGFFNRAILATEKQMPGTYKRVVEKAISKARRKGE